MPRHLAMMAALHNHKAGYHEMTDAQGNGDADGSDADGDE